MHEWMCKYVYIYVYGHWCVTQCICTRCAYTSYTYTSRVDVHMWECYVSTCAHACSHDAILAARERDGRREGEREGWQVCQSVRLSVTQSVSQIVRRCSFGLRGPAPEVHSGLCFPHKSQFVVCNSLFENKAQHLKHS